MPGVRPTLFWKFYVLPGGSAPVEDILNDLPKRAHAAMLVAKMEQVPILGMLAALQKRKVRKLENDLYEVRASIDKEAYRVLFTLDGATLVALSAFDKKSQEIPLNELDTGRARLADYKARHSVKAFRGSL